MVFAPDLQVEALHIYVILGSVIFALVLLAGIAYMRKMANVSLMLFVMASFLVFALLLFYFSGVYDLKNALSPQEFMILSTLLDIVLIIILVMAVLKGVPTLPLFAFISLLILLIATTVHYVNYYLGEPLLGVYIDFLWLYQMMLLALFIIILGLALWYQYGSIPRDAPLEAELSETELAVERFEDDMREKESEAAQVESTVKGIDEEVTKETPEIKGETEVY